ncbi:hypothetical protein DNTS_033763, partial [Danionella cerebrum]
RLGSPVFCVRRVGNWAMAAAAGKTYSFKVVLLGEGCVGKTSLVLRYCENKFNDKHITTLQASFLTKKLNITGKRDTAGQERFHALGPIYYRDSNGAILVYDVTDEDSFQKASEELGERTAENAGERDLFMYSRQRKKASYNLTFSPGSEGNKIDLEKERNVSVEEAEGENVVMCPGMMETAQVEERSKGNGTSISSSGRRGVQIVDDEDPQSAAAAGGCCSSG